jgi:phospholipid/cholesterol/gamma-HCH transport system substrate-binding protein
LDGTLKMPFVKHQILDKVNIVNNNLIETLIGAMVIGIAAVFFVFAYSAAGVSTGVGGYRVSAQFERIDGVSVGTDVRMAGIKVGTVVSQRLDFENYEAIVVMSVDTKLKLPDDSTAKVSSEGLLGGTYIALEPGGSEKMLADGGKITNTQSSINLLSLIGQAVFGNSKKK